MSITIKQVTTEATNFVENIKTDLRISTPSKLFSHLAPKTPPDPKIAALEVKFLIRNDGKTEVFRTWEEKL